MKAPSGWFSLRTLRPPGSIPMSMAMATRSSRANPSDARIPCPVCGQQIHPVAGRCKHCKTDLVRLREQQGMRAPKVDLAAVGSAPVAAPPTFIPSPTAEPGSNGHNGHAPPATYSPAPEIAPPPSFIASYPDTPAPAHAVGRAPRWPLIVVLLAGIAIIVCAYILLFAKDDAKPAEARKSGGAMPAPDRMDTMPAPPPPVQIPDVDDPWTQPPSAPPPSPPIPDPGAAPTNPFAGGPTPTAEDFTAAMIESACQKAASCGLGQAGVDACNALAGSGITDLQGEQIRAGQCTYDEAKARRCLDSINGLSCTGTGMDLDSTIQSFMGIGDCTTALVCR